MLARKVISVQPRVAYNGAFCAASSGSPHGYRCSNVTVEGAHRPIFVRLRILMASVEPVASRDN